tara:strand:+ start:13803 stop:14309 length:507 start_codon:yes stop_codon:yes gene_type:complete
MKNDFDNLILKYLSIYNEEYSIEDGESSYYKDIGDEYHPHMDDIHRHEDDRYQQKADAEEYDAPPEICPECEGDMYDGKCVTCDSNEDHEDNESEYGDHYRNDADSPRNNYGHSFKDGDYPDEVDYKDNDSNNGDYCPECENEGCVDQNGRCHYCDPEDKAPEAGIEY